MLLLTLLALSSPPALADAPADAPPTPLRVVVDPGHGVAGNSGNFGALCVDEQDETLRIGAALGAALDAHPAIEARLSRRGDERPDYPSRVAAADAWPADALISIHTDARGEGQPYATSARGACLRSDGAAGFAILWSDEGSEALVADRQSLARALAGSLVSAGFEAYPGLEYESLYQGDAEHPGVFLDRHVPRKRILMLRRPQVPSVIIEVYHAWDVEESQRWQEPATLRAFEGAVAAGLEAWADRKGDPAAPAQVVIEAGAPGAPLGATPPD